MRTENERAKRRRHGDDQDIGIELARKTDFFLCQTVDSCIQSVTVVPRRSPRVTRAPDVISILADIIHTRL